MKTIKHIFFLSALIFIVAPFFESCKKGPEDPLSLRTRKKRLVNDWVSVKYLINGTDQVLAVDSTGNEVLCNMGNPDTEFANSYTDITDTTNIFKYRFKRDGTFSYNNRVAGKRVIDYAIDTSMNCGFVTNTGINFDTTIFLLDTSQDIIGDWNFGGGVGTKRNREQLVLTDFQGDFTEVWDIVKLSSDEVKLEREFVLINGEDPVILQLTLEPQ